MWSYEMCGPRTGDRYDSVTVSSVTWGTRMNGRIAKGTAVIQTRDDAYEGWDSTYFEYITRRWERVLVGKWFDFPIFAMIVTNRSYDFASGELTLTLADIGELLRKRHYFPASAYSSNASLTIGPHTPTSMLKAHALNLAGGGYFAEMSARRMPLHAGEIVSGNRTFTTKQSEFLYPWDYMVDAANEENGIDWLLEPSFGSGSSEGSQISNLQWWFRTGRPMEQRSVHHFTVNAPDTPLSGLTADDNGEEYATTVFAVGEGTGDDRPVRRAGSTNVPELPRVLQLNQVSDVAKLATMAAGERDYAIDPPDSWSFQMPASYALARNGGQPDDGVRVGSRIFLDYTDRYYGEGQAELYVIGLSGDGGELVNVEVQTL